MTCSEYRGGGTTNKVTQHFGHMSNKKRYISTSKNPIDTKLDMVVTYGKGFKFKKLHELLIT